MKCPYCNNEMEEGSISNGRDIFWKNTNKLVGNAINLKNTVRLGTFGLFPKVKAYICKDCKKVIVDYDNNNDKFK